MNQSDSIEVARDYVECLVDELAQAFSPNSRIKPRFTGNTDLIGTLAESLVRDFVRRMVYPLRVSRGGIIYEGNAGKSVPQIDLIIWQPCPMPPIFEVGDFALIPRHSAIGFVDIKRSAYKGSDGSMVETLAMETDLLPVIPGENSYWKGLNRTVPQRAIGVYIDNEDGNIPNKIDDLRKNKKAVVLVNIKNEDRKPMTDGMITLVNFLMDIRRRAQFMDGLVHARLPEVTPKPDYGQANTTTTTSFSTNAK